MTTLDLDAIDEDLPTQAPVEAAQRRTRMDTADFVASLPAEVQAAMIQNITPALKMFADTVAMKMVVDIQQSSVMRLAAEMQKVLAPVAQMQLTVAPIQQMLAQMHAALAPVNKAIIPRNQVLEVVRALRALLPAPVAKVVVQDFLRLWHIRLSALAPGHLRAQIMPRSTPPRGPLHARAPGALRMILFRSVRRECLAV